MSGEIFSLIEPRIAMGRPSTKEVRIFGGHMFPVVRNFPNQLEGEIAEAALHQITYLKEDSEQRGITAPRSSTCAAVLDESFLTKWVDLATDGFKRYDVPYSRFMFDLCWGISFVWRGIQGAVDESDRSPEESDQNALRRADLDLKGLGKLAEGMSLPEGWSIAKMKALELRQLIEDDSTGFSLADSFVGKFRDNPKQVLYPVQVQRYALTGAETANIMYKKLYKLAEPIYSSR
jgi:hypothetical protein